MLVKYKNAIVRAMCKNAIVRAMCKNAIVRAMCKNAIVRAMVTPLTIAIFRSWIVEAISFLNSSDQVWIVSSELYYPISPPMSA
jgi:uncharacterized membrane protein